MTVDPTRWDTGEIPPWPTSAPVMHDDLETEAETDEPAPTSSSPVADIFETQMAAAADPIALDDPRYPVPAPALTPELIAGAATTRANLAAQEAEATRPLTAEEQADLDAIEAEAVRTGRSRVDLLNERRPLHDRRADGGSSAEPPSCASG